jgi:hypothetical protein
MVPTEGERELAAGGVRADGVRDGLADLAHEARVLEDPDRRVVRGGDLLELVVAVELDGPAEALELLDEPGLDEPDRAGVDAGARLATTKMVSANGAWEPTTPRT